MLSRLVFTLVMMLLGGQVAGAQPMGGAGMAGMGTPARTGQGGDPAMENMGAMNAHMLFTQLRPERAGDRERAGAILGQVRQAISPYVDARRAEADGFSPNSPSLVRKHYHFSRRDNFILGLRVFDVSRPTSLLYDRTPDGQFHLTGVMYTAAYGAPLDDLDARIPLSIARWHQHLNVCEAPQSNLGAYRETPPRFGTQGSITTAADCAASGGRFVPHLFGWMVHIYPLERDPARIWAIDHDG